MIKGYYGKTYTVNYGGLEIEMTEEEYAVFISRRPGGSPSGPPLDPAPQNLVFTNVTTTSLTLGWDVPTGPTPTGYKVARKPTSSGSFSVVDTPVTNSSNQTGLTQNTSYDEKVLATDAAGDGPYSSVATVVTLPGQPQDLAASSITTTGMTLTGAQNASDGSAAVTYEFQRKVTGVGSFATVGTPSTPVLVDTGLTANTSYDYRYREVNAGGNGAWSNTLTQDTLPGAPTSPTASSVTTTAMHLAWTAPAGGSQSLTYTLERKLTSQSVGSFAGIYTGATASFDDSGLTQDESYDYRVKAHNTADGAYSSTLTQITLPGAPQDLAVSNINNTSLTMTGAQNASDGSVSITYEFQRQLHTAGSWATVQTGASNVLNDTGLTQGTTYDYRYREVNSQGNGAWSNIKTQATKNPPGKARSVKGTPANTKIFVNFLAPSTGVTPDSYTIDATPSAGGSTISNPGQNPTLNPDGTLTAPTGTVTNGTAYDVTVTPISASDGNGPPSDASAPNQNITPTTFSLSDLGSLLLAKYDADHVTVSGGLVQSIADQSANALDLATFSGTTKWSVNSTLFNGAAGLVIPNSSNAYKVTHTDTVGTGFECYAIFVNSGIGGDVYSNSNLTLSFAASSNDSQINAGINLTNGGVQGQITLNSAIVDTTLASGHRLKQWKNGDQTNITEGNSTTANNSVIVWGAATDGSSFTARGFDVRSYAVLNGTATNTQRQQVEGTLAWEFPLGHLLLPSGHPYYSAAPSGNITAPAAPTGLFARPNGTSGSVRLFYSPAIEGGALPTYYATSTPGSITTSATPTSANGPFYIDMTGLTNGTAYTAAITPQNAAGSGSASSATTRSATPVNNSAASGLLFQYRFDESSGNLLDSWYSGYDLTVHGSPGNGTASPYGTYRSFAGSDWFVAAATNGLDHSTSDFSWGMSAQSSSVSGNHQLITIRNTGTGTNINGMVRLEGASPTLYIGNGSGGFASHVLGTITVNTDFDISFSYNRTTGEVRYSFNGGAIQSWMSGQTPGSTALNFGIGGVDSSETWSGRIYQAVGVSRKWTDGEVTGFHNGGAGTRF